jgi:hypothetical protein
MNVNIIFEKNGRQLIIEQVADTYAAAQQIMQKAEQGWLFVRFESVKEITADQVTFKGKFSCD